MVAGPPHRPAEKRRTQAGQQGGGNRSMVIRGTLRLFGAARHHVHEVGQQHLGGRGQGRSGEGV